MPDHEQTCREACIAAFDAYAKATQNAQCNDKEIAAITRAVNSVIYLTDQNNQHG